MNKKFTTYIIAAIFILLVQGILAQKYTLKLSGKDSTETKILNELKFKSKHLEIAVLQKEVKLVTAQIQKLGYFSNLLDSLIQKDSIVTAKFSLGTKTNKVIVNIPDKIREKYVEFSFSDKDSISFLPADAVKFIEDILQELDQAGKSFAEIQLTNPILVKEILFLTLSIKETEKRIINKVLVKGYPKFPKTYIKKYFEIENDQLFSKDVLKDISRAIKSLNFAKEIKPPEVLFKKD